MGREEFGQWLFFFFFYRTSERDSAGKSRGWDGSGASSSCGDALPESRSVELLGREEKSHSFSADLYFSLLHGGWRADYNKNQNKQKGIDVCAGNSGPVWQRQGARTFFYLLWPACGSVGCMSGAYSFLRGCVYSWS